MIFQEFLLVEEEVQMCEVFRIDLIMLFKIAYHYIGDIGDLEDAIRQFIVLTPKIGKCTFKELPNVDGLQASLVTIFFQQTGFKEVNLGMSHRLALILDAFAEQHTKFGI